MIDEMEKLADQHCRNVLRLAKDLNIPEDCANELSAAWKENSPLNRLKDRENRCGPIEGSADCNFRTV